MRMKLKGGVRLELGNTPLSIRRSRSSGVGLSEPSDLRSLLTCCNDSLYLFWEQGWGLEYKG